MGAALTGSIFGNWRKYRVGDYRVIANIEDRSLNILAMRIGDRKVIYKTH